MMRCPIKVLVTTSRYEINGVCRALNNLIENLDNSKFKISFLVQKIDDNHYPLVKNIDIVNLNVNPVPNCIAKIRNIFNIIISYRKTIESIKPDVILSFGCTSNRYVLLATLFSKKRKIILSERSERFYINYKSPLLRDKATSFIYRVLAFLLYRRADCIVSVSKNIAELMRRKIFIDRHKIKVIYNSVDISKIDRLCNERMDDFYFEKDKYYIGVVSRLSHEKGVGCLIESMKYLVEKVDAELVLIGDGQYKEYLKKSADMFALGDKVHFLGYKSNPYKYLKHLDVFVLASHYEGFSNVILEAMACGVPVVASDTKTNREIIKNGIDGMLVDTKNIPLLSNCIFDLLTNKGLKEKIRAMAYKKIQSFSISNAVKQYEYILNNVIF